MIQFPAEGISVSDLFEYWLNIMEPPSRYMLKTLSSFVEDEKRAEKLREFASKNAVSLLEFIIYLRKVNRSTTGIASGKNAHLLR